MPLSPGTRLGPYEIVAPVGAGGMGEVYRARDTRLDRTVAIKILPEAFAADPQLRERLDREARTISQLDHPHICALYDVGEHDGTAFLVMQYLEGETLEHRLKKGALPLEDALKIAIEMVQALSVAHRYGVIHRDVKPGNVMMTKTGAKLLDFGLAKTGAGTAVPGVSMLPTAPRNLTAQGTIFGTLQYMAPEQLERKEADARTDLFAFGAVLYEMLTGRKAFEGKTQANLIGAILEHDPPSIATHQPLAPPALDRIVKSCVAKDPDERWQTARDLLRELTWLADSRAAPARTERKTRERTAWGIAAVALVLATALAVPRYFLRVAPESPPLPVRFEVQTPATTDASSFALSADGRQLAFVASGGGVPRLWVRPLDQVIAQSVPGTEGASFPFWAPDSSAIGFFADGKLKRISLVGNVVQMLADAPGARGGTWSSNGDILFTPTTGSPLMRVSAAGGTTEVVTRLAAGQSHRWPQFLPDGRRFIFLVQFGKPEARGIYLGTLDRSEPTRVLASDTAAVYAPPGYLLLVRDSVLVALPFDAARRVVSGNPVPVAQGVGLGSGTFRGMFAASANGVLAHRAGATQPRQVVWVDRTGAEQGSVGPLDENALASPELAPDGRRVAVFRTVKGNINLWLIDVRRGVVSRFTFDANLNALPLWSPDGHRIVFQSYRSGVSDLFEKPVSGGDEQPLLVTRENKIPLSWSSDGRFLLYAVQGQTTGSDLWALPLSGERKPFPVLRTPFDETAGQFSPDGRWIAYQSNESGHHEVYIRPFAGPGDRVQVSASGGTQPRWRPDGKELFYVAPDARLMAVPVVIEADAQTLEVRAPVPLFQTHLASGDSIVPVGGFAEKSQYVVAPDGRFLMNVSVENAAPPPITVVLNWTAGLKK